MGVVENGFGEAKSGGGGGVSVLRGRLKKNPCNSLLTKLKDCEEAAGGFFSFCWTL